MNTTLKKPKRLSNKNSFLLLFSPPRMLRRAGFLLILFLLSSAFSCKDDPPIIPPPPQAKLTLTLKDVSCTEAWLNFILENITLPVDLELKKDSTVIKTFFSVNSNDTTLYLDSLLPNQTYNLQLTSIPNPVSSNELSVTTMDTTSHNFTWQTFEFGQHSSSVLYDVAIIDENNIWAVGEIYMNDSLGNIDPNAYNAVHWDGNQCEVKRIYFPTVCGSTNLSSYPSRSILAFNDGQIWVSSTGDKIAILENGVQINQFCLPSNTSMSINKIWGNSSSDLYVVGNNGNIAHYNGSQWAKIESGTTFNCKDIYGKIDIDNDLKIFVAVNDNSGGNNNKIIQIKPGFELDTLTWAGNTEINSLWFYNSNNLYACGDGIWNRKNNGKWSRENEVLPYFKTSIRGNAHNNVYAVGVFGFAYHFNGVRWNRISELSGVEVWAEVNCKNQIVAVAGTNGAKAVVTIGIHN